MKGTLRERSVMRNAEIKKEPKGGEKFRCTGEHSTVRVWLNVTLCAHRETGL